MDIGGFPLAPERECATTTAAAAAKKYSRNIAVLGMGDLGRSLAMCFHQRGIAVVLGSRNPEAASSLLPAGSRIASYADAASEADLVIIAVMRHHYSSLHDAVGDLAGKTLLDLSNNKHKGQYEDSNAEHLAKIFPQAHVVKGLNTLSAWALQSGLENSSKQVMLAYSRHFLQHQCPCSPEPEPRWTIISQVFICGDDPDAKTQVHALVNRMGLMPVDRGSLAASQELENIPLELFPTWRLTVTLSLGIVAFFYIYSTVIYVLYYYLENDKSTFYQLAIQMPNNAFPCASLVMLALVYLPGVLAGFVQLHRGTKYSRFPGWLDRWLRCRKELGIAAFLLGCLHAVYTLVMPIRKPIIDSATQRIINQIAANKTTKTSNLELWQGELYLAFGILGIGVLAVQAIVSLPSVGNSLNWREFRFVQSTLGYLGLALVTAHTICFGGTSFLSVQSYSWGMPHSYMISLLLPCAVLVFRFLLALPCLARPLSHIRQGWERGTAELKNTRKEIPRTPL
uniref:Metalloreductase STEAP4-like n=1 Tax=Petromyzon marinus TaxID=7757 RepID=A0AAJ7SPM9_PETMA|nr:metalloreductase STEAP4-like [Petromyzon marinus]